MILQVITFCVVTFCVKKVITFCVGKLLHFELNTLLHFASMLLHFASVLHFAAIVITFCVSITFCGDYYILRRNNGVPRQKHFLILCITVIKHEGHLRTRRKCSTVVCGSCFLYFSNVLKCPECFITVY